MNHVCGREKERQRWSERQRREVTELESINQNMYTSIALAHTPSRVLCVCAACGYAKERMKPEKNKTDDETKEKSIHQLSALNSIYEVNV